MNVFYLHHLPLIAASMHCDKHVGKMLIETCQLLATAHHEFGNGDAVSYRPTHKNHPSAIWARQSKQHYMWLVSLGLGLGHEFFRRYGKTHKSYKVLVAELQTPPAGMNALPYIWQDPPMAMPDEYKCEDTVLAYRLYYASKKDKMPLVYYQGTRPEPTWLRRILSGDIEHSEHYTGEKIYA